jgi:general secretion pathway protein D
MAGAQGPFSMRRSGTTSSVRASADDYSNSVVVNAPERYHEQIARLIEQIDRQADSPHSSRVFTLQYASAVDLVTVVQNILTNNAPRGRGGTTTQMSSSSPMFPFGGRSGSSQTTTSSTVADQRTNSLVVTSTPGNLSLVEQVLKQLDKPIPVESGAFVVTLENARADAVAQLLNQSFSSSRTSYTQSSTANRTTSSNTSRLGTSSMNTGLPGLDAPSRGADTQGADSRAAGVQAPAAGSQVQGLSPMQTPFTQPGSSARNTQQTQNQISSGYDSSGRIISYRDLNGTVVAIPDVNTNSVIIVTAPQNREIVQQILAQLDRIPEQVMIETLVVEASLDAASKFGVEWNFTKGNSAATSSFGLQGDTQQPQGLRYTLTGTQYEVFLQALKSDSRFEVLSTPRIFTSNNSTAEINISQSLPYVTNQRIDSNGNYAYSYSFMDVGIVLTVTPRITSNGYVTMDVTQTANDFVRYTDFNAPVVNQREAQTTVSVKDGETIVLGGIIKSSVTATTNKVPLLGDIPLLGNLFRSSSQAKNKTELLVFLTPHVVRDPAEARRLREQTESLLQSKTLGKIIKARPEAEEKKEKPAQQP